MQKIKVISRESKIYFRTYLNPLYLLRAMMRYKQLLRHFIWWEVNDRYRGSALGLLWTIIVPLIRLSVYTLVFSIPLGGKKIIWGLDSNLAVGKMIFCGFILFNVFSESVGKASRLMWVNKSYVKNIVFPLEIIPVTTVGVAVVHSFIGMGVLIALELITTGSLHWTLIYLPLVYLPLIFFVTGISWMLSAFGVFSRDIDNLMQSLIQMLFLLSGIIFPLGRLMELVPEQWHWVLRLNVISSVVEDARRVVLEGQAPDWFWLNVNLLGAMSLLIIGYAWFMSRKRDFADVI
jgi:lipopolysaccharide transport system permease protein